MIRFLALSALAAVLVTPSAVAQTAASPVPAATVTPAAGADATDPFLWLEDVNGARAQAWVKSENAKTLAVLQRDPRFGRFYAAAHDVRCEGPHPLSPSIAAAFTIFGATLHTCAASGARRRSRDTRSPRRLDDTARPRCAREAEDKNWVWRGADCDSPSGERCLISLSEGGEDASTIREFDLTLGAIRDRRLSAAARQAERRLGRRRYAVRRPRVAAGRTHGVGLSVRRQNAPAREPLADAVELARGTSGRTSSVGTSELHDGRGQRLLDSTRAFVFETERQSSPRAVPQRSTSRANAN